jgi:hypothetical protein
MLAFLVAEKLAPFQHGFVEEVAVYRHPEITIGTTWLPRKPNAIVG